MPGLFNPNYHQVSMVACLHGLPGVEVPNRRAFFLPASYRHDEPGATGVRSPDLCRPRLAVS